MKSLLAVLAVTSALGIGYWKYKNPNGGIEDAKTQAGQVVERLKGGMDAVKNPDAAVAVNATTSGSADASATGSSATPTTTGANSATTDAQSAVSVSQLDADTAARLATLEATVNAGDASGLGNELLALQSKVGDIETVLVSLVGGPPDPNDGPGGASAPADIEALVAASLSEALETQSSDATAQLDALSSETTAKFGTIETTLADVNSRLSVLDNRLDTLISAASGQGSSTDAADSSNAALDPATIQLDQRLAELEAKLTSVQASANAALSDDQTASLAATTDDKIAALENKIESRLAAQMAEQLAQLESRSSANESLKNELMTATGRIAELEAKLDEQLQSERLQSVSVQTLQNELQAQLTELTQDVNEAADRADLATVSNTLNRSRARIETLEQRVDQLPDSIAADNARGLQQALQTQIRELEAQLAESAQRPDEELVTTLSSVQEKVNALEQQQFVTAEDLQELSKERSIQYKIYFDKGRDAISPAAAKVLDSFIKQESKRATGISIFGTTDRVGSSAFNQRLALRRANSVRSYLIQRGFEFNKIQVVDGIGEDLAAAKLADGKEDPNQRSVILFAFQP